MCHTHWRQYTNALRKTAVARKAAEPAAEEAAPAPVAPAHEHTLAASPVGEGEPIEKTSRRRTRRSKAAEAETEVTIG